MGEHPRDSTRARDRLVSFRKRPICQKVVIEVTEPLTAFSAGVSGISPEEVESRCNIVVPLARMVTRLRTGASGSSATSEVRRSSDVRRVAESCRFTHVGVRQRDVELPSNERLAQCRR